jgi:hypothetical protein
VLVFEPTEFARTAEELACQLSRWINAPGALHELQMPLQAIATLRVIF